MRIDSKWWRPHGMHIETIRIESGLYETTLPGVLKGNWLANQDSLRHNNAMLINM